MRLLQILWPLVTTSLWQGSTTTKCYYFSCCCFCCWETREWSDVFFYFSLCISVTESRKDRGGLFLWVSMTLGCAVARRATTESCSFTWKLLGCRRQTLSRQRWRNQSLRRPVSLLHTLAAAVHHTAMLLNLWWRVTQTQSTVLTVCLACIRTQQMDLRLAARCLISRRSGQARLRTWSSMPTSCLLRWQVMARPACTTATARQLQTPELSCRLTTVSNTYSQPSISTCCLPYTAFLLTSNVILSMWTIFWKWPLK